MTEKKTTTKKDAALNIQEALSNIQKTLKAPKGQKNTFGKYSYRSCEDILEAVKSVMPVGYSVTLSDEIVLIGDRYYIKATASLVCGCEFLSSTGFAREAATKKGMDDSQITGATSSYARKYALNGLFAIDDTKDADTDEHARQRNNARTSAPTPVKTTDLTQAEKDANELARQTRIYQTAAKTMHKTLDSCASAELLQATWDSLETDLAELKEFTQKGYDYVAAIYHGKLEGFKG